MLNVDEVAVLNVAMQASGVLVCTDATLVIIIYQFVYRWQTTVPISIFKIKNFQL
jgi:hypothetical protein